MMSILCKAQSIRDVIAFPKSGAGSDPLFESPAPARFGALDQYGIRGAGHHDVLENAADNGFGPNTNTCEMKPTGTERVDTQTGSSFGPSSPSI